MLIYIKSSRPTKLIHKLKFAYNYYTRWWAEMGFSYSYNLLYSSYCLSCIQIPEISPWVDCCTHWPTRAHAREFIAIIIHDVDLIYIRDSKMHKRSQRCTMMCIRRPYRLRHLCLGLYVHKV